MKSRFRINKKIIIVIILVLACIITISIPFFMTNRQENNFQSLSSKMKTLLTQIQNVDASSTWRYSETCRDQYTGAFPTGDISCSAAMSLQQSVTRAAQISQLHESYFKIIDANEQFLPVDELDLTPSDAFGKKFVVSTAERRYEVKDIADVSCRYILSLGQRDESSTNFSIGSPIEDSRGTVLISITCTGDATNYWYAKE